MANPSDQVFPSGVVWWAALMVWSCTLVMWVSGAFAMIELGFTPIGLAGMAFCGIIGAAPLSFIYRTHYTITASELLIRAGAISRRVQLNRIKSVTPKLTLGLNYAMSRTNVLQVNVHGQRFGSRISPRDLDAFLDALEHACPQLSRRGDTLDVSP